jgi:phosphatidate cytidylyltransferase
MEKLLRKSNPKVTSLAQRLISAAVLIPLVVGTVLLGGWWLTGFIAIFAALAGWEMAQIFEKGGYRPWKVFVPIGCAILVITRQLTGIEGSVALLGGLGLVAMAFYTISFERGIKTGATDYLITIGAVFYVGWLAGYIMSLRQFTGGQFWTLLILIAIALADAGAYFVGSAIGKHKMLPVVSPNKTWEGYLGGIVIGTLFATGFALWFHSFVPAITWQKGILLGVIISVVCPMGDFGESMLKRQFGQKDSSQLIPGHGGFLDRIDSYLWAAIIGFYLVNWFLI